MSIRTPSPAMSDVSMNSFSLSNSSSSTSQMSSMSYMNSLSNTSTPIQTPRFIHDLEKQSRLDQVNMTVAFFNETLVPTVWKELEPLKRAEVYRTHLKVFTLNFLACDTQTECNAIVYHALALCEKIKEMESSIQADLQDELNTFERMEKKAEAYEIGMLVEKFNEKRSGLLGRLEGTEAQLATSFAESDFIQTVERTRIRTDRKYQLSEKKAAVLMRAEEFLISLSEECDRLKRDLLIIEHQYTEIRAERRDYYAKERRKTQKIFKQKSKLFHSLLDHLTQHMKELITQLQE